MSVVIGDELTGIRCDAGLVDKFTFIYTPIVLGGRTAPTAVAGIGTMSLGDAMRLTHVKVVKLGDDIEITGYPAE